MDEKKNREKRKRKEKKKEREKKGRKKRERKGRKKRERKERKEKKLVNVGNQNIWFQGFSHFYNCLGAV